MFNLTRSRTEVAKYRSGLTGLTIAIATAETPIVHGEFCLATRAKNDDGLPHILEHLIYQGSEEYPYQGALDLLAARCLAERTNAWTAPDHTCYELYTAGTSGFLEMLPIYLEHILFPRLRVEDFLTEVHHVNGDGEDAGVVYNEEQGSPSPSTQKAIMKLLYPAEPGYYVNFGGSLENLRTSTTIQKVRDYHKKYYRPENLVLIITGNIHQQQIFKKIASIEEKILDKELLNRGLFKRPWLKPLQEPIGKEGNHIVHEFPSDDESIGVVYLGFRLSNHITEDISMMESYYLLMKYLISSKASPLTSAFVESEDPLCYNVGSETDLYSQLVYLLVFHKVPVNRTGEVIPRLRKVIKQIIDNGPSGFDLSRLRSYIDKEEVRNQEMIENNLPYLLRQVAVTDLLYSTQKEHFQEFATNGFSALRRHNASYWLELLYNVFNNYDSVVVEGKPNVNLSKEYNQKEKKRIEKQKAELGQEGLNKKREELEAAIARKALPSKKILTKIPFGDVEKIQFQSIKSYNRTHNPEKLFDFSNVRLKVQISDIMSKFVRMSIAIDVTYLTDVQKLYLPLLLDLWADSPIKKNGTITSTDDRLRRHRKSLMSSGINMDFSHLLIWAESPLKKLMEVISYLSDLINYPYFTRKKLKETIDNKLLEVETSNNVGSIMSDLEFKSYYDNSSCQYATIDFVQKKFLIKLKNEVVENVDNVLNDLHEIIQTICKPEKSLLHVVTNVDTFIKHYGSDLLVFNSIFNESLVSFDKSKKFPLKSPHEYRRRHFDSLRHVGVGLESTKSCYLFQSILYNNTDWMMKSIPATRTLLNYLSNTFFYKVRGKGLAYTAEMLLSVNTGRIILKLYDAAQLTAAYKEVRRIFRGHLLGKTPWDETLVDSAKGELIYTWTVREESMEALANQAYLMYFRNVDTSYNRMFTKSLATVKSKSLKSIAKQILTQFLNADSTQTVIVCNKEKISTVSKDFTKLGFRMKIYQSYDDAFQVFPRKQFSVQPPIFGELLLVFSNNCKGLIIFLF